MYTVNVVTLNIKMDSVIKKMEKVMVGPKMTVKFVVKLEKGKSLLYKSVWKSWTISTTNRPKFLCFTTSNFNAGTTQHTKRHLNIYIEMKISNSTCFD